MGEAKRRQSEFNDAVGYLNRINTIFYACDNAAIELDAYVWFHSLMALFRELSTEMNQEEITTWEKKAQTINNHLTIKIQNRHHTGGIQIDQNLYMSLHKFELFLRKIYSESGLQKRTVEEATKALR